MTSFGKQQITTTISDLTWLKTYFVNKFQKWPLYVSKYQDHSDQSYLVQGFLLTQAKHLLEKVRLDPIHNKVYTYIIAITKKKNIYK